MRSLLMILMLIVLPTSMAAQCLTPASGSTIWDLETADLFWGRPPEEPPPVAGAPQPTGFRLQLGTASTVYTITRDFPGHQRSVKLSEVVPGPGDYYFTISPLFGAVLGEPGPECAFTAERTATPDVTAPVVSITSPITGTIVARNTPVEIRIEVSDDSGVVTVVIAFVNGQEIPGCRFAKPPYRCVWEVPPAANKAYRLQAGARDRIGHVTLSSVVHVSSSKGNP